MYPWPAPPSTRTLTVTKWLTVGVSTLLLAPMAVIVYGVADGDEDSLYALAFLVPFAVLLVLWCLPATSRGLMAKKAMGS